MGSGFGNQMLGESQIPNIKETEDLEKGDGWMQLDRNFQKHSQQHRDVNNTHFKGKVRSSSNAKRSLGERMGQNGHKIMIDSASSDNHRQSQGITPDGGQFMSNSSFQSFSSSSQTPQAGSAGSLFDSVNAQNAFERANHNLSNVEHTFPEDDFNNGVFMSDHEMQQLQKMRAGMGNDFEEMFVHPDEFIKPRSLKLSKKKHRKNDIDIDMDYFDKSVQKIKKVHSSKKRRKRRRRKKRKSTKSKKRRNRKLEQGWYNLDDPHSVYGYDSQLPSDDFNLDLAKLGMPMEETGLTLNEQNQMNNHQQNNMEQFNVDGSVHDNFNEFNQNQLNQIQQNEMNHVHDNMFEQNIQNNNHHMHNHNHHHHHYNAHPQPMETYGFNEAQMPMVQLGEFDEMSHLYEEYLEAMARMNNETGEQPNPIVLGKQINLIEQQLKLNHRRRPYFGQRPLLFPQMMSPEGELAMHMPEMYGPTPPMVSMQQATHHYFFPGSAFCGMHPYMAPPMMGAPIVPPMPMPLPSPDVVHNFQLLYDEPHPQAAQVMQIELAEEKRHSETQLEITHAKTDIEHEIKHEIEIEIGRHEKHEDEMYQKTEKEIDQLMDLTKREIELRTAKPQQPMFNVEHTVLGINEHSTVHQTKGGEIEVTQLSHESSAQSEESGESMQTTIEQKITPIIIDKHGNIKEAGDQSLSSLLSDPSNIFPGHRKRDGDSSQTLGSSPQSNISSQQESVYTPDQNTSATSSPKTNLNSPSSDLEEEIIVQRGVGTANQKIVEVHDDNTLNNIDIDEDNRLNVDQSDSQEHNEEHHFDKTHNEILNEKNTHIVHHMGQPDDKRIINVNLDLLTDGKGAFYVAGKDGVKGSGFDGNFDVLETQLDQIRNKELQTINSKQNQKNNGTQIENVSDVSDQSHNVVTKIGNLSELHEVRSSDLNVDINESATGQDSQVSDHTTVQINQTEVTRNPTQIIDDGTEVIQNTTEVVDLGTEVVDLGTEQIQDNTANTSFIQLDSPETSDRVRNSMVDENFKPSLKDQDDDTVQNIDNTTELGNNDLNTPESDGTAIDLEDKSQGTDNQSQINKSKVERSLRRNRKLADDPFKQEIPSFLNLAKNFLETDQAPRSLEDIAHQFDKQGEGPEPRELFEDLDMTAKLAPQLGISNFYEKDLGFEPQMISDSEPLF